MLSCYFILFLPCIPVAFLFVRQPIRWHQETRMVARENIVPLLFWLGFVSVLVIILAVAEILGVRRLF